MRSGKLLSEGNKPLKELKRIVFQNGLCFTIGAVTAQGIVYCHLYSVTGYNAPTNFQPMLVVTPNIVLPNVLKTGGIQKISYPKKCSIDLTGSFDRFAFNVMLVTDEG